MTLSRHVAKVLLARQTMQSNPYQPWPWCGLHQGVIHRPAPARWCSITNDVTRANGRGGGKSWKISSVSGPRKVDMKRDTGLK